MENELLQQLVRDLSRPIATRPSDNAEICRHITALTQIREQLVQTMTPDQRKLLDTYDHHLNTAAFLFESETFLTAVLVALDFQNLNKHASRKQDNDISI